MSVADAVYAVKMGENPNVLLDKLREAGNEDAYFALDARLDKNYNSIYS